MLKLRLPLLITLTFIAIFTATLTARIIGARTQEQIIAAMFTNRDGSACLSRCLFGVTRGVQTEEIALHPVIQQNAAWFSLQNSTWGPIRIRSVYAVNNGVWIGDSMGFSRAFTIGDLIGLVGQPAAISIHRHSGSASGMVEKIALDFPDAGLCAVVNVIRPRRGGDSFSAVVPRLPLSSLSLQVDSLDSDCGFYTRYRWRGFMSFALYRAYIPR